MRWHSCSEWQTFHSLHTSMGCYEHSKLGTVQIIIQLIESVGEKTTALLYSTAYLYRHPWRNRGYVGKWAWAELIGSLLQSKLTILAGADPIGCWWRKRCLWHVVLSPGPTYAPFSVFSLGLAYTPHPPTSTHPPIAPWTPTTQRCSCPPTCPHMICPSAGLDNTLSSPSFLPSAAVVHSPSTNKPFPRET